MKKVIIIILCLVSVTTYAQHFNKSIASGVGVKALRYNVTTGQVTYADTTSGGSSAITVNTTTITGGTTGAIPFNDAGVYSEEAGVLFWDKANNRLGVGTNTPGYTLQVTGKTYLNGSNDFGTQAFGDAGVVASFNGTGEGMLIAGYTSGNGRFNINLNGNQRNEGGLLLGAAGGTQDASSLLEVRSTTQGLLMPRMTAAQGSAIGSPANGLVIYVTDTNGTFTSVGFWGREGGAWVKL